MDRWRGRVAVVTGASAGIGAAIAYQLQDAGVEVVALARRVDKIPGAVETARKEAEARGRKSLGKASTPGKLHCVKCDLANEQDVINAFKWVKENTKGVSILVNNAGIGGLASLTETNSEDWKAVMDTNLMGLCYCTREAVQQMRANGVDDGHVIHISSTAGHVNPTLPSHSFYFAAKHGVRIMTEGLRKELVLAKSRIRVTEVSPGYVRTEFFEKMGVDTDDFWKRAHLMSEDVADGVLYVLSVPPHVQIHEMLLRHVHDP